MFVDGVARYMRVLVDEPSTSYLTASQVATYLEASYAEFQNLVIRHDPSLYLTQVDINPGNTAAYDLAAAASAVRILGNPAGGLTGPRLVKLVQVSELFADGTVKAHWKGVTSQRALTAYGFTGPDERYWFAGTVIRFNRTVSDSLTLYYQPYPTIDWTKQTSGQNEVIDDLHGYHDIIALLAARKFLARDDRDKVGILRELEARQEDFRNFLIQGRSRDGNDVVLVEF